jgi:hypothetical protein
MLPLTRAVCSQAPDGRYSRPLSNPCRQTTGHRNRARHTSFTGGAHVAVALVSNVHSAAAAPELRPLTARRAGKVPSPPISKSPLAGGRPQPRGGPVACQTRIRGPRYLCSKAEHEQFQDALRQMPTGILISASDPNPLNSDIDAATLGPAEERQPNKPEHQRGRMLLPYARRPPCPKTRGGRKAHATVGAALNLCGRQG